VTVTAAAAAAAAAAAGQNLGLPGVAYLPISFSVT